jgi:DNA modification methylase
MGSGTTLVVAKELNRNYIGCDIQEKAVKITKERLKGIS